MRYVALSRARSQIFVAYSLVIDVRDPRDSAERSRDRWAECGGRTSQRSPRTIEFRPLDVETTIPFSTRGQSPARSPVSVVPRRRRRSAESPRVSLPRDTGDSPPLYVLLLDDLQEIGQTTPEFGDDLIKDFGSRTRMKPPGRLDGLIITAVETTAGDPELTIGAGLGRGGFWLVPRILGFAQPDWRAGAL